MTNRYYFPHVSYLLNTLYTATNLLLVYASELLNYHVTLRVQQFDSLPVLRFLVELNQTSGTTSHEVADHV